MGENLGQHFLEDQSVVTDIISAGEISKDDTVLEIGPGKGVLTEQLLQKSSRVVAVEKDPGLVKLLHNKFTTEIADNVLDIVKGDIRDYDLSNLVDKSHYRVTANIPYYLTSELLQKLLQSDHQPEHIVVLVQKEVAERITTKDNKHSRMSLLVQAHASPKIHQIVKPKKFSPPPRVDSAILSLKNITDAFFANTDREAFFDLIRIGFQHKRKTIKNNLVHTYDQENILQTLNACKVEPQTRPERLSLANWRCLHKKLMS
jgi:16S rRNA (adenine1518-N6/adenine1519-N6)-dimethyltransferase